MEIDHVMDPVKSEIEIQAVNLTQQWYSLAHEELPDLANLLTGYLHYFSDSGDRQQFLKEALRIAEEMSRSPKAAGLPGPSITALKDALSQHLDP